MKSGKLLKFITEEKGRARRFLSIRFLRPVLVVAILVVLAFLIFVKNGRYIRLPQSESAILNSSSHLDKIRLEATKPLSSVLLITVDTLRPDYLGANGCSLKMTPAIDALIERGLYFSHALTPIPRTTQALAALLTGCYPYKTEVRSLWDRVSPQTVTMAEMLHKVGYKTIAVVSNHLLTPERSLCRGFDIYDYDSDKRNAVQTSEVALGYLDRIRDEKPFFLWIHYIDPHVPYYPPKDLVDKIDPEYKGPYKYHFGDEPGGIGERAYPRDLGKERIVYHNDLPPEVNLHIRKLYAADVAFTDTGIKTLMEGLRNRTPPLILFTADHGESLGEHEYYYDHGDYLYDSELRVPLAFVFPEGHPFYKRGRVSEIVSLVDVLPTVLDLLGIRVLSGKSIGMDGDSLMVFWRSTTRLDKPVFAESDDSFFPNSVKRKVRNDIDGRFRSIALGNWKLIWTPFKGKKDEYELYDLDADPAELLDLSLSESERLFTLNRILANWMAKQPKVKKSSRPSIKDIERLRSLGYLGNPIRK